MVSVVVLTKVKNLKPRFPWADEVIVVVNSYIKDFSKVRNDALKRVKGEWVLFLDDDEQITEELKNEILKQVQDDTINGYLIKREDYFWNKKLRFGETNNVYLLRLAKKNAGLWQGKVHEFWRVSGTIKTLNNLISHNSHPTINSFITKLNYYTNLREKEQFSLFKAITYPVGKFIQNYFLRLGVLDGMPGFVMAFMMSLHSVIYRIKCYEQTSKTSTF